MFLYIEQALGTGSVRQNLHTKRALGSYSCTNETGTLRASIVARNDYPATFMTSQPDGSVLLGYCTEQPGEEDEFLHILIQPDGSIRLKRDLYCTLPLFAGHSGGIFIASNSYEEVVRRMPRLTLDKQVIACFLTNHIDADLSTTIWQEVNVIGERETLLLQQGRMRRVAPPPRNWAYNSELKPVDPRKFLELLERRLEHWFGIWSNSGSLGFEVSGGLDSSMLPLYLAKRGYSVSMPAESRIYYDPVQAKRQKQKLDALEAVTPLRIARIPLVPERHQPLAKILRTKAHSPVNLMHPPYDLEEVVRTLKEAEVTIVARGVGGDELLEHRPHPSNAIQQEPYRNKFAELYLTPQCLHMARPVSTETPSSMLSPGVLLGNLAACNEYIESGIWPVSPFYDLELFNFCQALPIQFRANKNIFRAYYEANGFPSIFYIGPNEDFRSFFYLGWRQGRYDDLFAFLWSNSTLHRLGYVDKFALNELYRETRAAEGDGPFFDIYNWMIIELNLQCVNNWQE